MADMNVNDFYAEQPATIACVIQAAHQQRVPANILLAIASVEGGKNGQAVGNKNGSVDMGHFQINSVHLKKFVPLGITKRDILQRGCYNAELAAWMLHQVLNDPRDINAGVDYWTRAANYHSRTPRYNRLYRAKLVPLAEKWGNWLSKQYKTVTVAYK